MVPFQLVQTVLSPYQTVTTHWPSAKFDVVEFSQWISTFLLLVNMHVNIFKWSNRHRMCHMQPPWIWQCCRYISSCHRFIWSVCSGIFFTGLRWVVINTPLVWGLRLWRADQYRLVRHIPSYFWMASLLWYLCSWGASGTQPIAILILVHLLKNFATKISVVDFSDFLFFLFKGIVDLVIQPSTCEDELKGLFDPSKVYDYITGIAHGKVLQVCVLLK